MTIRTTLAALALALAPSLAAAMGGCSGELIRTSTPCGEGQVWDTDRQVCTTPVTG